MKDRSIPVLLQLLLLLFGGVQALSAQGMNAVPASPSPVPFSIYVGSQAEPTIWYIENDAISNTAGEVIAEMGEDARQTLFARLERLGQVEKVSEFVLDRENNTLLISMESLDTKAVLKELEGVVQR